MSEKMPTDALTSEEEEAFARMRDADASQPVEEEAPEEGAEDEAPAESEAEGAEPEAEDKRDDDRKVPLRALTETREQVKALKAELERQKEAEARYDERVRLLMERYGQPQEPEQPAEPEPLEPFDPDKHDVFDYLKRQSEEVAQLRGWKQETERERAERVQREQQAAAVQDFQQRLAAHEQTFAQQNPDYFDRLEAYSTQEAQRRAVLNGYGNDPRAVQQVAQQVKSELFRTAYGLVKQGQDPAAYFYQALANYAPARTQEAPPEPGAAPEDKFQSLKGGSGNAGRSKKVHEMSEDEFRRVLEDPKEFRKLAGG